MGKQIAFGIGKYQRQTIEACEVCDEMACDECRLPCWECGELTAPYRPELAEGDFEGHPPVLCDKHFYQTKEAGPCGWCGKTFSLYTWQSETFHQYCPECETRLALQKAQARIKERGRRFDTTCPGCGRSTTENGHRIHAEQLDHTTLLIFCPKQQEWFTQYAFFETDDLLPDGQQMALPI